MVCAHARWKKASACMGSPAAAMHCGKSARLAASQATTYRFASLGSATARGLPGRQTATTVQPACNNRLHNAVPTAPVGPVTITVCICLSIFSIFNTLFVFRNDLCAKSMPAFFHLPVYNFPYIIDNSCRYYTTGKRKNKPLPFGHFYAVHCQYIRQKLYAV